MSPRWNAERKAWVFVARSVRTPPLRVEQKRKKRQQLIAKCGSHCWLCNRPIINETPTLDHVTPRALGGSHDISNLRLAHGACNKLRGHGPVPELLLTKEMQVQRESVAA